MRNWVIQSVFFYSGDLLIHGRGAEIVEVGFGVLRIFESVRGLAIHHGFCQIFQLGIRFGRPSILDSLKLIHLVHCILEVDIWGRLFRSVGEQSHVLFFVK